MGQKTPAKGRLAPEKPSRQALSEPLDATRPDPMPSRGATTTSFPALLPDLSCARQVAGGPVPVEAGYLLFSRGPGMLYC